MKRYRNVGAFAPSSRFLAKGIAQSLPKPFIGALLELGPGTGSITKGLITQGISEQQIIAIENSEEFAKHMRATYPEVTTLCGSAEHMTELLAQNKNPINAIVSSLPLRILPKKSVEAIIQQIDQTLEPKGYYIQYTYLRKENPVSILKQYQHIGSKKVWLNLPPARVDVFQKN